MTEREVCLKQWLEKIGGSFGLNLKTLRPASSDAGFRSYFRIDGDGTTYIVMDSPGETGNVKPFIFVDDLFAKQGINVPKIFAQDVEQGFLLLSANRVPCLSTPKNCFAVNSNFSPSGM